MRRVAADYLIVGAGAAAMAFADALLDHADVRVALVDRRHGVAGHWLDAYPFVRLHQASAFYGVASTPLGGGRLQRHGPETGLQERAGVADICSYYARVLAERMIEPDRAEFFGNCEYVGGGGFVSQVTGERFEVPETCRIVDAHYVAPEIPARTPAPFLVDEGARVVPVNELARVRGETGRYVLVGSGKTATDACVWLLQHGVDPDAICWVRPREPWMFNRAVIQPEPIVFLGMAGDLMASAAASSSLDELFLRLEHAGIVLRIDPSLTPTMAKTPTLATWELDLLRTVRNVVRLGHLRRVQRGRLELAGGTVAVAPEALVVHCAAPGLVYPPLVPIWRPEVITLQPIRAGFPCFGAALAGYVEATRGDDAEKNRLCPPSPYGDSLPGWASMFVRGTRASMAFAAEPDIKAWADGVLLNPARVPPDYHRPDELGEVLDRLRRHTPAGLAALAALGGLDADALAPAGR